MTEDSAAPGPAPRKKQSRKNVGRSHFGMAPEPFAVPPITNLNYFTAPGLSLIGCEYPSHPQSTLAAEKLALLQGLHAGTIIDLTEDIEGLTPYADALLAAADKSGTPRPSIIRFPIRDRHTPSQQQLDAIVARVTEGLADRGRVVVHCWGGIGRTGMVLAAVLVHFGWPVESALAEVNRRWRATPKAALPKHDGHTAPESEQQRDCVREWARRQVIPAEQLNATGVSAATARACLLGGALGDALGAPVEFMKWPQIQSKFGPDGIQTLAPAYGRVGAITDDTQMTLFTAEGVLRSISRSDARGICNPDMVVHHAYRRWLSTQGRAVQSDVVFSEPSLLYDEKALHSARAPGITCVSALQVDYEQLLHGVAQNTSKGCGTVMRVAPIGLNRKPGEAYELGRSTSALTHGHPTGYIAGGCFADIISRVARGTDIVQATREVALLIEDDPDAGDTLAAIQAGLTLGTGAREHITPRAFDALSGGWTAESALAIALACAIAHHDDFVAAVCLAVNHSGDSDSTGSMAGQLVGMTAGLDALPVEWLEQLELRELIELVADDLALGEPNHDRWPGV